MVTLDDIGLFIDSGWNTIPYDSIIYTTEGKKVANPPIKWKEFTTTTNTKRSAAGAVICDKVLVIDCDSLESTQAFLDIAKFEGVEKVEDLHTNKNLLNLIGLVVKTQRGYHFYFKNEGKFKDCHAEKIDVQATKKKIVYLPSKASEGKEIIVLNKVFSTPSFIELYPVPKSVEEWLLKISKETSAEAQAEAKKIRYSIGTPLAKIQRGSELFYKRLTPKSYRKIPFYRELIDKKGFLHPNDIPNGEGNDYLVSLAGILSSDCTIDINAFWEILEFINNQWSEPLTKEALVTKLEAYPLDKYEGCPFVYDENWEKLQYSFIDVDGNDIMMVYDLKTSKYLIVNLSTNEILVKNATDALSFYANRTGHQLKATQMASRLVGVNLIFNPIEPFGLSENKTFNTYKNSVFLDVLNSESTYTESEQELAKDCLALSFIEHLFKEQSSYFLRFLKTKLTNFAYSPVSFCLFDDEGGAGKGALEVFLSKFVGGEKVTKIPYSTFQSKFTSDFEGKLFLFCNEYPDDFQARRFTTDKLKDITGSPKLKIEKKGVDPYEVDNFSTIFVTSNRISIELKEGDRRFCVVQCDKKFDEVFKDGFFEQMISYEEMTKFAIYLKYFVSRLNWKDYMSPPNTLAKELFVDCVGSDMDAAIKHLCDGDFESIATLSEGLIYAKVDAVNLTKLSSILNLKSTRYLTQGLRKKIGQGKLDMEIFYDTNRKFDSQCFTYGIFKAGTLAKFLPNKTNLNSKI